MKRIARVFPSKTNATPVDDLAFAGQYCDVPAFPPDVDEVHVSCTFSWDIPLAERLVRAWSQVAPTRLGGPATGEASGEFQPGMYLKAGYVITSRGCPNRCWFCSVWRREGAEVRELPIRDGFNVLDDNLLACSEEHIRAVFAMLKRQPQRAQFTGGLEAARLKPWHVELLADLNPGQMFFAYDTPDDLEPLREAGKMLLGGGIPDRGHRLRCYVLCGYPRDTFDAAEKRMRETIEAGFFPMAMLYRDSRGRRDPAWARFQRHWARPEIVACKARGDKHDSGESARTSAATNLLAVRT